MWRSEEWKGWRRDSSMQCSASILLRVYHGIRGKDQSETGNKFVFYIYCLNVELIWCLEIGIVLLKVNEKLSKERWDILITVIISKNFLKSCHFLKFTNDKLYSVFYLCTLNIKRSIYEIFHVSVVSSDTLCPIYNGTLKTLI